MTALLDGSNQRVLASYTALEGIDPPRAPWSPDGKTLAFIHHRPQPALTTIAAEGGEAQPEASAHWEGIRDLTWLSGSRQLVVAGSPQAFSGSQLYEEVSVEGGETQRSPGLLRNAYASAHPRIVAPAAIQLTHRMIGSSFVARHCSFGTGNEPMVR